MAPGKPVLVEDIMSTVLVTVTPDDDLNVALQRMTDHRVRRLPVVREERGDTVVVGMLSDRDLRLAANSPFLVPEVGQVVERLHDVRVVDVMTTEVVSVPPTATVGEAAERMLQHQIGGMPVVEWEGDKRYLLGIVTRTDMLARLIVLEAELISQG